MMRWIGIAARLWLVAGGILFVHGALTGRGIAASVFDWELRHSETIWPKDIYEGLLVVLVIFPAAVLVACVVLPRRTKTVKPAPATFKPQNMALVAGLLGTLSILLAGLAYGRTLLLPQFDEPAIEVALDQVPNASQIDQGQAVVLGVAQVALAVAYEEGSGGGKTSIHRQGHRFIPITPARWMPNDPVRIVADAPIITVHDQALGRYRSDREGDSALPTKSVGILLRGQIPAFVEMAFARRGVTLSSDVLLQSTDRQAGRTGWYVGAALLTLAGALGNGVAIIVLVSSSKTRRR